ncbi:tRNA (adenosine(37)-N6)-dimethylallyltransferase MiaA [Paracoccaceae bacterium GXU_MW_L88]
MNCPVLIAGPTASGKSALALEIAAARGVPIVNADALQVYANWRVLTARPSPAEEAAHPHRLYGHIPRDTAYSVGHWLREVEPLLPQNPVIIGGTGLYFMALTEGLAPIPPISPETRQTADAMDPAEMRSLLEARDPETAAKIDLANPVRIQRAYEVLMETGRGLSSWQAETPPPLVTDAHRLVFRPEVDWLNTRINRRFDQMIAEGALEEAAANRDGFDAKRPADQALGAKELVAHLSGTLPLEDAIAAGKLATRQFAKRQRTWFRKRMRDWHSLDPATPLSAQIRAIPNLIP